MLPSDVFRAPFLGMVISVLFARCSQILEQLGQPLKLYDFRYLSSSVSVLLDIPKVRYSEGLIVLVGLVGLVGLGLELGLENLRNNELPSEYRTIIVCTSWLCGKEIAADIWPRSNVKPNPTISTDVHSSLPHAVFHFTSSGRLTNNPILSERQILADIILYRAVVLYSRPEQVWKSRNGVRLCRNVASAAFMSAEYRVYFVAIIDDTWHMIFDFPITSLSFCRD